MGIPSPLVSIEGEGDERNERDRAVGLGVRRRVTFDTASANAERTLHRAGSWCRSMRESVPGTLTLATTPSTSAYSLGLHNVHVRLHAGVSPAKAITREMTAAEAAFANAPGTLHFPDAWLETDAGHVLLTLVAVEVIHIALELS